MQTIVCKRVSQSIAPPARKLLARAIIARMSKITVTHFTDPGCPFAYSASPALAVLRWRYGDQLDWRLVTIGLAEDPQRYVDAGYTPTRSTIGQQSYFKRFGMPLLMEPRARVHRHLARLPRDRRHAPAATPDARTRCCARCSSPGSRRTLLLDEDADIAQALARVDGLDVDAVIAAIDDERDARRLRGRQAADAQRRGRAHRLPGQGAPDRRARALLRALARLPERRRRCAWRPAAFRRSRPTTC